MKLQGDEAFERFVQKRSRLNAQLDDDKARIDAWLQENLDSDVNVVQLGILEGLLKTRSDRLQELLELDESFMAHLVSMLHPQETSG